MTSKITWTHVDAHVRSACETAGILPFFGATDAEVAYNYLKYLESKATLLQQEGKKLEEERDHLKSELQALEAKPAKVGKTKQGLAALEKSVAELQSRGFGEKLISACEQVNAQMVQEKADPFGPRDADGWYTWNGDDTMRPAGYVQIADRDGEISTILASESIRWNHLQTAGDIVKWRPALPFKIGQCANKHCGAKAREISPYCEKCEPDL